MTVVSATDKKVELKWMPGDTVATGYIIERRPLNGDYAKVLSLTPATGIDTTVDASTTYVYRVRGTALGNQSDPSNEVTVGPPPYGYNTVVATPANPDAYDPHPLGASMRMTLDSSGDPAIAYVWNDPNQDHDLSDSALYFVRWDRVHYRWTNPVKVATIAEVTTNALTAISIAQDFSTGIFGLAFENESDPNASQISIAFSSDGGQNWTVKRAAGDTGEQTFGYKHPSLAMAAGKVHLVFYHDFDGVRYVTGKAADEPAQWSSTLLPVPGGYDSLDVAASLALDSAGQPGVAYLARNSDRQAQVFWRPGASPVLMADNGGFGSDDNDLRLTFSGTRPRAVYTGAMDDQYFADYDHTLWILASADDGSTWFKPVNIRSDGNRSLQAPLSIASGSHGQLGVVSEDNGGNLDNVVCNQPKLSLSGDLVNWTTCGPSPLSGPDIYAGSPSVAFSARDTIYLAFQQMSTSDATIPNGVIVWRQPPDWTLVPPGQ